LPPTWKNLFYPPERDQYTYFAFAAEHPFPAPTVQGASFDPGRAAWAADAAMLAYGRFGATPMAVEETHSILAHAGFTQHELIGNWTPDGKGTQGFFASNSDFAILSFRGTERGDLGDLVWDLEPLTVTEPPVANGRGAFRVVARVAAFLEQRLSSGVCSAIFIDQLLRLWPHSLQCALESLMRHAFAHEALLQEGSYTRHHPERSSSVCHRRLCHGERLQVPDQITQVAAFRAAK